MTRLAISPAAAALLRALLARAGTERDRILLTQFRSIDWQSLTFVGERHEFELRLSPPESCELLTRILSGLGDAELEIPGYFVADIAVVGEPDRHSDGSVTVALEALTLVQD